MRLRKLRIEDAPLMLEWMHDESVVKDLQTDFASKTIDDCERFIACSIIEADELIKKADLLIAKKADALMGTEGKQGTNPFDGRLSLNLAITDDNDEYMGTVSLKHIYCDTAEFGIAIRSTAIGKGYSRLAMKEIRKFGFERFGMNKLYWCVDEKNARALRFYDKNNYPRVDILSRDIADVIRKLGTYSEDKLRDYVWYVG